MSIPTYPAEVLPTPRGFSVRVPGLLAVEGRTEEEAINEAVDVLDALLLKRASEGLEPPKVRPIKRAALTLTPSARAQSSLLFMAHRGDVPLNEIGRRIGSGAWNRVKELELGVNATLDRAERAAKALGYQLVLRYEKLDN